MKNFRITEQDMRVTERSYDVLANSEDEAQGMFEAMNTDDKDKRLVHEETIQSQIEIINVESTSRFDAAGTLNPDWEEGKNRFAIQVRGYEPEDDADGGIWTHKLNLTDYKYLDSDRLPIYAVAAGKDWESAFARAGEMMVEAYSQSRCIF